MIAVLHYLSVAVGLLCIHENLGVDTLILAGFLGLTGQVFISGWMIEKKLDK